MRAPIRFKSSLPTGVLVGVLVLSLLLLFSNAMALFDGRWWHVIFVVVAVFAAWAAWDGIQERRPRRRR
jgi:K+ transporter